MYTNINITNNEDQYKYIIEYCSDDRILSSKNIGYLISKPYVNNKSNHINDISFWFDNTGFLYHGNYWIKPAGELENTYIPEHYRVKTVKIYFPHHSVETYMNGVEYALTLSTWIHGRQIILGSYIINRLDLIACDTVKTFMNQKYYEYTEFTIINPYDLVYSDDWANFRKNICDEPTKINNTGSILYASLHPVSFNRIENHDVYMKVNEYIGGQNSINLLSSQKGDMCLNLSTNVTKPFSSTQEEPSFRIDLIFNNVYKNDLKEYLEETYNIHQIKLKYRLIIGDENNLYVMIESDDLMDFQTSYTFTKSDIFNNTIRNNMNFIEGVNVIGSVDIIYVNENAEEESLIYLLSNKIPLTQDVFRFFRFFKKYDKDLNKFVDDFEFKDKFDYVINNINLDDVDMNLISITPINKIEQTVIQTSTPADSKPNLMNPIFFRTTQLANIIVHPMVTETICLNLDTYKSKVDSFMIQIEGINFIEIGRNKYGVLFKINGKKLPKINHSGTYYILDSTGEMVTYGKYNYE